MRLSVVITAYDQHPLTVMHVREVMNSTRLPDEIVVVNDGGDDSLLDLLDKLPKKCPVVYAKITQNIVWNQCGARNLGIWLSRGDLVSLEDNDHIPFKDYYKEAEKLVLDGYDSVSPKHRHVIAEQELTKPSEEWTFIGSRGMAKVIAFCRREILLDVKGFDEQFSGRYGWDVPDFVDRLDRRGIKEILSGNFYVVDVLSNKD